jgi:flagellar hook-associated protein 2
MATTAVSTSNTNVITTLGAGSGVDTKSLATSLVNAERAPKKAAIDAKITKATNNVSGYDAIKYVLGNLKTAFADLKDQSKFNSTAPGNSQPLALSVTAGATAATGIHAVTVTALAAAQRSISGGFAASNTVLNAGAAFSLSLSVNGAQAQKIDVPAGSSTPAGIVSSINAAAKGVTAQLVNTGDAATPFKIMLTGSTGTSNNFTLKSDNGQSGISVVTTQGTATVAESTAFTFGNALTAGQSVTIGGLTYTSTGSTTATELATAFASLARGATTGAGTATGTYSGTLTDFATGVRAGTSVTATSVNSYSQTFASDVLAGTPVTLGGLTYTPTANATAAQLAAAFASLAQGATTGPSAAAGSYTGSFTGYSTSSANGATLTVSSLKLGNVTDLQTIGQPVTGLGFDTQLQSAANAALTVNGVAITSSSNSVEGAIAGVTLNLSNTTTGAASLNFSRDTAAVKTKLQALVTAFNDANSMLGVVSDPKSTVTTYGATLVGNSSVNMVRSQIRAMVMGTSSSPSDNVTALRDLGITINKSGNLDLDATKLNTALSSNFDKAVTMLSANRENLSVTSTLPAGLAGDAVKQLTSLLASTGALTSQSANATSKISAYQKELTKLETRMTDLLARYTKQFAAMDNIVGQTSSLKTSLTNTFNGILGVYNKS